MLTHVKDHKVRKGTKDRAKKTLPSVILTIKSSSIHGKGVFSTKNLPQGLRFGPYEGIQKISSTTGYAWRLRSGRFVEAANDTNSNWMRFVNCARTADEQNLMAFQYMGEMYYRTAKQIASGEELLVYYGDEFAEELGIDTVKYFQPETVVLTAEVEFVCEPCGFVFSEQKYLMGHNKFCRYVKEKVRALNRERGNWELWLEIC